MHTVFHYTAPGTAKRDFSGSWSECRAWIASTDTPASYYMRVAR